MKIIEENLNKEPGEEQSIFLCIKVITCVKYIPIIYRAICVPPVFCYALAICWLCTNRPQKTPPDEKTNQ